MPRTKRHLLCFGCGYSAQALAGLLTQDDWEITGTSRSPEAVEQINALGYRGVLFDGTAPLDEAMIEGVTHLLISVPPDETGDPVLRQCDDALMQRAGQFAWAGYLSTTGVYGDRGGDWVDETSPPRPDTERGRRRAKAEAAWTELGLPLHIFRLAGIYGPGRNQLVAMLNGTAKRIVKPSHVFSRVHVADIAGALMQSITRPQPGEAYNICDDEPCPPQDVVAYAAELLGMAAPPEIDFDRAELSPMARSFYADSKRVSNRKMKQDLGYELIYPSYREGLSSLLAELPRRR